MCGCCARSSASDGGGGGGGGGAQLGRLVGVHVRRGDKRDLGAKERGEPFSDAMYVTAAKVPRRHGPPRPQPRSRAAAPPPSRRYTASRAVCWVQALAREVGAEGFLLASSEPNTLTRLPPLLLPLPTYVMPAHHFVDVPEGKTPHQVEEE